MYVKKSFGSYNDRRYGKPWGAKVTFPDGVKPHFEFVGRWDGSDVVLIAEPGEIVAFGQKDHRGGNTSKRLFVIETEGTLREVTEGEARNISVAPAQEPVVSPLAGFSTEELLAELRSRGLPVA